MAPLFWIENKNIELHQILMFLLPWVKLLTLTKKNQKQFLLFSITSPLSLLYTYINSWTIIPKFTKKKWTFSNKFSHVRLFLRHRFFLLRKGWQHNIHLVKNPLVWPLGWPACNSCCVSWFQLLTFHVSAEWPPLPCDNRTISWSLPIKW